MTKLASLADGFAFVCGTSPTPGFFFAHVGRTYEDVNRGNANFYAAGFSKVSVEDALNIAVREARTRGL